MAARLGPGRGGRSFAEAIVAAPPADSWSRRTCPGCCCPATRPGMPVHRWYALTEQALHQMGGAGILRPAAEQPARAAFRLVGDLAERPPREQIATVLGAYRCRRPVRPVGRDGHRRGPRRQIQREGEAMSPSRRPTSPAHQTALQPHRGRRPDPEGGTRTDRRVPRAERRRQDHHHPHADRVPPPDRRVGERPRARRPATPVCSSRIGYLPGDLRIDPR